MKASKPQEVSKEIVDLLESKRQRFIWTTEEALLAFEGLSSLDSKA